VQKGVPVIGPTEDKMAILRKVWPNVVKCV